MSWRKSFYSEKGKVEGRRPGRRSFWVTIAILTIAAITMVIYIGRIPTSSGTPGQNPYAQTMGPQGKRVYVDPAFAFTQARIDYAEGFAAIRREFRLLPVNKYNYKKYMTFGWQLTQGSDDEKRQAREISSFLDIYENCFQK